MNENIRLDINNQKISQSIPARQIELETQICELTQKIKELEDNLSSYKRLFESAPLGYQSLDKDGVFLDVNTAWMETLGYGREEIIGTWFGDLLAPDCSESFRHCFSSFLIAGTMQAEFPTRHKDGTFRTIAFEGRIDHKSDGSVKKAHCILQDVTERTQILENLRRSEESFRIIFEGAPLGMALCDFKSGRIIRSNRTFAEIIGRDENEMTNLDWQTISHPDDLAENMKFRTEMRAKNRTGFNMRKRYFKKDGSIVWINLTVNLIGPVGAENSRELCMIEDITLRQKDEDKIRSLSYHDPLTGVYNRRFYEEELSRLDVSRNLPITLVMADINGLKLTNDAFGHKFGDHLLIEFVNVLKKECRSDEIIARIGGDEFILILPKTDASSAQKLIARIKMSVENTILDKIILSVAIGFAVKGDVSENMGEIFRQAEENMYKNKLSDGASMRSRSIDLIMNTLYEKNTREKLHSIRVSELCEKMAIEMNYQKEDGNQLRLAGLMHDIGKIGIPESILNKKGPLTNDEWNVVKKHAEIGYRILSSVNEFSKIADHILAHREKWDGSGYPRGLKNTAIPVDARMIAIANAYDAMTSERPYDKTFNADEAAAEIRKFAGTQFDPEIAKFFVEKVLGSEW